jgi:hypothetical protein
MYDVIERPSEAAATVAPVVASPVWRLLTRVAFRFCATYFIFYIVSTQMIGSLMRLPSIAILPALHLFVTWVATRLLGFSAPLVMFSGSGDKPFDWALALVLIVIATTVTVAWSLLDRRRLAYPRLYAWVYMFVRLAVGATMISYGMAKVIPLQMPFPNLMRLLEPYGQFSLMGVLWAQVGASPAFERFTGGVELAAGLLLFVPRFSLLGALLSLLAASFIFVLNMTYDVPVKLFSLHLVVMSLFLLAPHASRLLDLLLLNRATEPHVEPRLADRAITQRVLVAAQIVLGAFLVFTGITGSVEASRQFGAAATKPPLYGIWTVTVMTLNGEVRPPLTTDVDRWRRVVISNATTVSFQHMDDTFETYRAKTDTASHSLTFPEPGVGGRPDQNAVKHAGRFSYEQSSPDHLILDGTIDGKRIRMELDRVDHTAFRLLQSRFRWIQDYPFNR